MNLLGSTWTALALGAAALAMTWLVLHMLRVRLERVTVPTLLFFRVAATPERPRVLGGRPRRWLAYLLALLASGAAWFAFADPVLESEGRSRLVLVDASGTATPGSAVLATRLARARELAAAGLGPRGAVLGYTGGTVLLWNAGEAPLVLDERARGLVPSGGGSGLWAALAAARNRSRSGDEVLVLGGPELPEPERSVECFGIRVVREESAGGAGSQAAPLPAAPAPTPRAVAFVGDVPRSTRLAVLAAPLWRVVDDPTTADLVVVRGTSAVARPCLRLDDGTGAAEREPMTTPECPVRLGMRDRKGVAPALADLGDATPWVIDARTGAALVAARATPVPEVRVATWLVGGGGETAHQDIPRLVLTALALLVPHGELGVVAAGDTLRVPTATSGPATIRDEHGATFASLPLQGRHDLVLASPGRYEITTPTGTRTVEAVATATAPAAARTAAPLQPVDGDGHLRSWLLLFALALLTLDLVLYLRGRLP